ncbi:MAG: SAM-dependent methyltransferase [Coxiellaceae bacterium]|nr:SAM-dependent methyltransferase [Coxiellaceae bacterium]
MNKKNNGNLTLIGSGIKFLSHLTKESLSSLETADKIVYLSNDSVLIEWLETEFRSVESLSGIYYKFNSRKVCYEAIACYVVSLVKSGLNICFLLYGHPIVFSQPGIMAVRQLIQEGYSASVLPAISAEDCLFADLLINPGDVGCVSYEATDFLIYDRPILPASHLIIWQVCVVGITSHYDGHINNNIQILIDKLQTVYPGEHGVVIYTAAKYPGFLPTITKRSLALLNSQCLPRFSTLYIPPYMKAKVNSEVLDALSVIKNK